ncbi:MAG TPA: TRAP transporter large permease subunit, partial [Candidatus Sulfotelmatobacter sp.]|nr:TRAP transporter large permease subunit [Candidatus Sulfotelmatobacter sp.]
ICIAAAIPAVLYYVALYFLLDFEAIKRGWTREAIQAILKDSPVRLHWTGLLHLVPVAILIYFMFVAANTAFISALWACLSVLVIAQLFKKHRGVTPVLKSLASGGKGSIEVAVACGASGIVLGALIQTGLGIQLSAILASLSGGNLYILLILTAISSLILGMGMPTTPCYIIVAVTVVPAIVKLGIIPLAAHMFVFYFGCISGITPPVAVAAYAAAGIARSDPFKSGWMAFRMGTSGFVLPFIFVTGPALLMIGDSSTIIRACVMATIAVIGLSACIVGHGWAPLMAWERIAFALTAILLIHPGLTTDVVGTIIFGVLAVRQYLAWKRIHAKALGALAMG